MMKNVEGNWDEGVSLQFSRKAQSEAALIGVGYYKASGL